MSSSTEGPRDGCGALLSLVCGLPGAGKTTLARVLEVQRGVVRLCPDEWLAALQVDFFDEPFRARMEAQLFTLGLQLLALGQDVVCEFGFWSRQERTDARRRARVAGAWVELCWLDPSTETLWERLRERNLRACPGDVVVTRDQLETWTGWFERPDAAELAGYDLVRIGTEGVEVAGEPPSVAEHGSAAPAPGGSS